MIPCFRLINPQANRSFVFKWEKFDLNTRWHYHPEVELIYFIKGKTTGVTGDAFHEFSEGDLVLLGADFPHVLQQDPQYSREFPGCEPFGLIIQFTENFLGKDFLDKAELAPVKQLLGNAKRGLLFRKAAVENVAGLLLDMHAQSDSRKLVTLLDVLVLLSDNSDYNWLNTGECNYDLTFDEMRMQRINQFVYDHFMEPITITDVAGVANMTETSFCRYFKTRTLKTFIRFLNEVRITYSCKLLNDVQCSISDACFESGFNSLSYFNRQFKTIMKMSPMQYKQWKNKAVV